MCKYVRSLSCIIAMFLILFIASFAFASSPNLLENPSFEEVDVDGFPVGWERVTDGLGNGTITFGVGDEEVISGDNSATIDVTVIANPPKINKLEGLYRQRVQIEEGQLYKITFNYYKDNIARAMPYIVFQDSAGAAIKTIDGSCIYDYSDLEADLSWDVLPNNGALSIADTVSNNSEWIQRWIIVEPPAGTSQIEIRMSTKGGTVNWVLPGTLYIDDMSAEQFVDMDFYYSVDTNTNTITLTEACYPALNSFGANYMWEWDFGDGNTSFDLNPTHTYSSVDEYTVTLTLKKDGQVISSVSKTFIAIPIEKTFVPGPNPVSDILSIYYDVTSTAFVRVYDMSGNAVLNAELGASNPYKWDLTDENGDRVPRGFYIVQIVYETGEVAETHTVYVSN